MTQLTNTPVATDATAARSSIDRAVLVLTAPRSGSSWLASLLRSCGTLGLCREWLTSVAYPGAQNSFALPEARTSNRDAFVDALRAVSSTPNGVAAAKIIASTLDTLPPLLGRWGIGDGIGDGWITELFPTPVVVVLRRLDRIGQAISWWRAVGTNQYARPREGVEAPWPPYDFSALQAAMRATELHGRALERMADFLRGRRGVRMIDVTYEDTMSDPGAIVRSIAALAGIQLDSAFEPRSDLSLQRSATSESIRARYQADLAAAGLPTDGSEPSENPEPLAPHPEVRDDSSGVHALGHRRFVGGDGSYWDSVGDLQFRFLVQEGLRPQHVLLDFACGALRGGVRFIPYLDDGNYLGFDRSFDLVALGVAQELGVLALRQKRPHFVINDRFDLSEFGTAPDFAIAQSLFTHLTDADISRTFQAIGSVAKPTTRLYATYFPRGADDSDNPPASHSRLVFRQAPDDLARLASAHGWEMRPIGDWGHPRGQHVALFVRKASR